MNVSPFEYYYVEYRCKTEHKAHSPYNLDYTDLITILIVFIML